MKLNFYSTKDYEGFSAVQASGTFSAVRAGGLSFVQNHLRGMWRGFRMPFSNPKVRKAGYVSKATVGHKCIRRK